MKKIELTRPEVSISKWGDTWIVADVEERDMVDLSRPTEELLYNIESDHEELRFMHQVFAEILGGVIEQAAEVYARDEMVKGLTAVATPGWDYLVGFNDRAAAEEEEAERIRELAFWFDDEDEDC